MKIAIASSGLGHVARGIETWACDTAVALARARVKSYELSVIGGGEKDKSYELSVIGEGEKVKSYELSVIRNTNNQEPITNNSASGSPSGGIP